MDAARPLIIIMDTQPTDSVAERRVIVAVVVRVRALAYNLVLRVLLLVGLDLADHRDVVLHPDVVVHVHLVIASFQLTEV